MSIFGFVMNSKHSKIYINYANSSDRKSFLYNIFFYLTFKGGFLVLIKMQIKVS